MRWIWADRTGRHHRLHLHRQRIAPGHARGRPIPPSTDTPPVSCTLPPPRTGRLPTDQRLFGVADTQHSSGACSVVIMPLMNVYLYIYCRLRTIECSLKPHTHPSQNLACVHAIFCYLHDLVPRPSLSFYDVYLIARWLFTKRNKRPRLTITCISENSTWMYSLAT
jgi:hypothetical protein